MRGWNRVRFPRGVAANKVRSSRCSHIPFFDSVSRKNVRHCWGEASKTPLTRKRGAMAAGYNGKLLRTSPTQATGRIHRTMKARGTKLFNIEGWLVQG